MVHVGVVRRADDQECTGEIALPVLAAEVREAPGPVLRGATFPSATAPPPTTTQLRPARSSSTG
jgi:hypothetical protein